MSALLEIATLLAIFDHCYGLMTTFFDELSLDDDTIDIRLTYSGSSTIISEKYLVKFDTVPWL